jgi:hypothetical protein
MDDDIDPVDALESEWIAGVLFNQREPWLIEQVGDVVPSTGAKVVHRKNVMTMPEKCATHMRSEESGPTSDDDPIVVDHSGTPF